MNEQSGWDETTSPVDEQKTEALQKQFIAVLGRDRYNPLSVISATTQFTAFIANMREAHTLDAAAEHPSARTAEHHLSHVSRSFPFT